MRQSAYLGSGHGQSLQVKVASFVQKQLLEGLGSDTQEVPTVLPSESKIIMGNIHSNWELGATSVKENLGRVSTTDLIKG